MRMYEFKGFSKTEKERGHQVKQEGVIHGQQIWIRK
jgi:hypothetical protein